MANDARQMEEKKETNLRSLGRRRGVRDDSLRTESNGFDLPVFPLGIEFFSVELKVDAAGVSGLHHDFFSSTESALASGGQKLGGVRLAVRGDFDPRIFAGLNDDGK